jgi:hypothetical protein
VNQQWGRQLQSETWTSGQARVNPHPLAHHPLDACYGSLVDEPHLS